MVHGDSHRKQTKCTSWPLQRYPVYYMVTLRELFCCSCHLNPYLSPIWHSQLIDSFKPKKSAFKPDDLLQNPDSVKQGQCTWTFACHHCLPFAWHPISNKQHARPKSCSTFLWHDCTLLPYQPQHLVSHREGMCQISQEWLPTGYRQRHQKSTW